MESPLGLCQPLGIKDLATLGLPFTCPGLNHGTDFIGQQLPPCKSSGYLWVLQSFRMDDEDNIRWPGRPLKLLCLAQ